MKWLVVLFLFVSSYALEVKITDVNKDTVTLENYVTKGVSGYVLCPYENRNIICARAVAFGKKARLSVYDELKNDAFALPVITPKKGDSILLAKNYDRILIIAPDQNVYLKLKEKYKNSTVISSDNFAAFIDDLPTRQNFIDFARKLDIGRIVFALDKIYEVDAYSFYAVKKYGKVDADYKKIFFTTYPAFNLKNKNIVNYYKKLIKE